jgi:hypothetical protein
MFREILRTQWQWSRWAVVLTTILSFMLPVLTVQNAGLVNPTARDVVDLMARVAMVGVFYPMLALGAGVTMALLIWTPDHQAGHVYALVLPLPRWHYTLLRLAAGGALLLPMVIAMGVGAVVATSLSTIPAGLHPYPGVITIRFALALLLGYAFFFALASGTIRTTVMILGVIPVAFIALTQLVDLLGGPNLVTPVWSWLTSLPGPFRLLFEPWRLINV